MRKGEPPCPPPRRPGRPRPLRGSRVRLHPAAWTVCIPPSVKQPEAPTLVRQRAGPPPACNEAPSLLRGSRAWGPSDAPPFKDAAPAPPAGSPARCLLPLGLTPAPGASVLGPRVPTHSLCHRRPDPATRRSWWSEDRQHLRAPRVWPLPRPRPRSPARPRRPPSQPLLEPLVHPPPPRLPDPPPPTPRGAAPEGGDGGGGGAPQSLPRHPPGAQTSFTLGTGVPAELREPDAPLSEQPSPNAGERLPLLFRVSTLSQQCHLASHP